MRVEKRGKIVYKLLNNKLSNIKFYKYRIRICNYK